MKTTDLRARRVRWFGLAIASCLLSATAIHAQCPPSMNIDCVEFTSSLLAMKDAPPSGPSVNDKFLWKVRKNPIDQATQANFGDPVSGGTQYVLCLYAGNPLGLIGGSAMATIPGGGTCSGRPCWKAVGSKGWKYKDKTGSQDGIHKVILKGGPADKARILVKAKGGSLALPALPIDFQPGQGVLVQLRRTDGAPPFDCYSGWLGHPDDLIKNDSANFKAKN